MKVRQIISIIDRYYTYQAMISRYKEDLKTYRLANMLEQDDDKNTLVLKLKIAETEAKIGQLLDIEV